MRGGKLQREFGLEEDSIPVTDDELTFAKERLEEFEKTPEISLDWNEVKNKLFISI